MKQRGTSSDQDHRRPLSRKSLCLKGAAMTVVSPDHILSFFFLFSAAEPLGMISAWEKGSAVTYCM